MTSPVNQVARLRADLLRLVDLLEGRAGRLLRKQRGLEVGRGGAAEAYWSATEREAKALVSWASAVRQAVLVIDAWLEEGKGDWELLRHGLLVASMSTLSTKRESAIGVGEERDWWRTASEVERKRREIVDGPRLGSLPGVPYEVRDRVNRRALVQDVDLRTVDETTAAALTAPGRFLVTYTPATARRDAMAVVATDDVLTADRLAVMVPGVGTDVDDAAGHLKRLDRVRNEAGAGTAGVWWLGYDAPDSPADPAMLTDARAREAGVALARDLKELDESRPEGGRTTVVGHSFGSTVVASALLEDRPGAGSGPNVDAALFIGSPGAGDARHARELAATEVHVIRDRRDIVTFAGDRPTLAPHRWSEGRIGLGTDPATPSFGAQVHPVASDGPGAFPNIWPGHTSYFDAGTPSLKKIGDVLCGDL